MTHFDKLIAQENFAEYIINYSSQVYWHPELYESMREIVEYIEQNRNNTLDRVNVEYAITEFTEKVAKLEEQIKRQKEDNNKTIEQLAVQTENELGDKYQISKKDEYRSAKKKDEYDIKAIQQYLKEEEKENQEIQEALAEYRITNKEYKDLQTEKETLDRKLTNTFYDIQEKLLSQKLEEIATDITKKNRIINKTRRI